MYRLVLGASKVRIIFSERGLLENEQNIKYNGHYGLFTATTYVANFQLVYGVDKEKCPSARCPIKQTNAKVSLVKAVDLEGTSTGANLDDFQHF